jgi:50S ribosomal subunit-associated GTPase HflX
MLLHVVDITSHNASEQCQIVEDILAELGLKDKPRLTAPNKIDLALDESQNWDEDTALDYLSSQCEPADENDENTVLISATKRWGLGKLLELISRTLSQTKLPV